MLKKLLIVFAVVLLLLTGFSGWLLGTQSGLSTAVSLAEKLVPALTVEQAEGRLSRSVTLSQVHFRPDNASGAEIDKIQLRWQPSALLNATFHIESLIVDGVAVYSVAGEEEPDQAEIKLPEIRLPLKVEVARAQLADVRLIAENGDKTPLLTDFKMAVTADANRLKINQFDLLRDDLEAQLSGNITLTPPYLSELDYQLNLKQVLAQPLQLQGRLDGDINKLEIKQHVSGPVNATQTASISQPLDNLQWSLQASADNVDLATMVPEQHTRFEAVALTAQGSLQSLTATLQTRVLQPELPAVAISADIESDNLKLWQIAVDSVISPQETLTLAGSVDISGQTPLADLKASWQNLAWPLATDKPMISSPEGSLNLTGSLDDYQARIQSVIHWQQESLNLAANTSGSTTRLAIQSLNVEGFAGRLQATGKLDWQTAPLQYQLDADWRDMLLPPSLTGGRTIALKQGQVALNGDPDTLSLSTNTDLSIDEIAAAVQAEASGSTAKGFEQSLFTIKLADGSINYQGPLLWTGQTLLDGPLRLNNINPGLLAADWPGSLSGELAIKMQQLAEGIKVAARNINISGQLRQRPLQLSGSASYSDALIDVSALQLQSGQSKLAASGQLIEENINFNWSLQSPDLEDFYPDLQGQVTASGEVGGTLSAPAVNADLSASELAYEQIRAGEVKGKVRLLLADNADLNADITASQLSLPQIDADSLQLTLSGRQQQHDIALALESDAIMLQMQARGAVDDKQSWQGQLSRFDFSNQQAGQWQLTDKGPLTLSAAMQKVPEHCWSSDNGEFCLQADHKGGQWQVAGDFANLPLSLFQAFVVELEQVQGSLRGNFNLANNEQGDINGAGEVFLDDAKVQLDQSALNQQKPVPLNNVVLRYQLDASQTTASFHLEPQLDGVSAIDAKLKTAGINTLINQPGQARLNGSITTAVKDLSQLELNHPAFGDLKGQLDIDIQLAGTAKQPQIEGKASLQQGQVAIVDAGIVLEQIEANVNGDLSQVDFDLQARSGQGTLSGEGQFLLSDNSWQLDTRLTGKQLQVMNTPEALVIAEPDLTINVTPEKTLVKGKVHIPQAQLEPTRFNSSVSPSRDVVVVTEQEADNGGAAVTEIDITVSLGDKVQLQAMGFQGRLGGDLRVFGQTSDILLANGEIKIQDGTYLAYGQMLHIDDGRIRFAGGAIDNPELDIKAVRKGKDVKAGLHIQGYASAPQANLFSDPEMSQDDVLSYLILGKPLDQASATDAALLASAATGMGLQNGAMIGDQIASTFGLDEFTISGDSAENAALQVGKYLSPKLYLSYGIGVFESVSTVELRYQLSKIWALKAESGTESGVDLLYTFERGGPD